MVLCLSLTSVTDPIFFLFQGLDMLRRVSALKEEAQQLESKGLCKIETAVAGSEAEGLYRLLRGVTSHSPISSPPKKHCHTPAVTISKLPPRA